MKIFKMKVGDLLGAGSKAAQQCATKARKGLMALAMMLLAATGVNAQSLSGTDYTAGTTALETVATQVAAYVPYVVNLCYAIAGVVAIVGAISVYISMNNEEQDVKNILLHCFAAECKRKKMLHKTLNVRLIDRYFCFSDFCRSNY